MSIGPAVVGRIVSSNAEVKAELDAERLAAADPQRERMIDNLPAHLKNLEELLFLVRVNEGSAILGHRRYWLSQAMWEVDRLRDSANNKVRLCSQPPASLNGKPEVERYDYARDMLDLFVKADRSVVSNILEKTGWVSLAIFLGVCLLATVWLLLSGLRAMLWELAANFWGLVMFACLIGCLGLIKLGWLKFCDHRNSTARQRRK